MSVRFFAMDEGTIACDSARSPRCFALLASVLIGCFLGCSGVAARQTRGNSAGSVATAPAEPEPPVAATRPVIELEPLRIQVVRDVAGMQVVVATDARDLLDEGNAALADLAYERAIALYDELLRDFPSSTLVVPALFNAGLAHEGLQDWDAAVRLYLRIVERGGQGRDAIDAHVRAGAVYAEAQRWEDAVAIFDSLLARKDLEPADRLEGLARKGYVLIEAKDYPAAERVLHEAIELFAASTARGYRFDNNYYRAMAHYYLGDLVRRQFEALPIRLPDEQIQKDVEAKAALVIEASDRFGIAVEVGNIYWSTAAGFRLASMQHDFWTAVVTAPIPPSLGQEAAALYVEEVHRQALGMLEKALSIHQRNVKLAEVYKTPTSWSELSAQRVTELTEIVGREKAGNLLSPAEATASLSPTPRSRAEYLPARFDL